MRPWRSSCAETRGPRSTPATGSKTAPRLSRTLLVAAHATGLGAVWIGVYPVEERVENVRAIVGCPEGVVPMSMIALGHPAESKPASERFTPEFVHLERWNP